MLYIRSKHVDKIKNIKSSYISTSTSVMLWYLHLLGHLIWFLLVFCRNIYQHNKTTLELSKPRLWYFQHELESVESTEERTEDFSKIYKKNRYILHLN